MNQTIINEFTRSWTFIANFGSFISLKFHWIDNIVSLLNEPQKAKGNQLLDNGKVKKTENINLRSITQFAKLVPKLIVHYMDAKVDSIRIYTHLNNS